MTPAESVAELHVVEAFVSPWDAHICRGLLESEGISASLLNQHHISVQWPMALALGGVRVCVDPNSAERAKAVLAARDAGEYEVALCEEYGLVPLSCGVCGSNRTAYRRDLAESALLLAMMFAFGVSAPPSIASVRCRECGTLLAEPPIPRAAA
jgi:Putative prokaryotic signal transducing protein